MTLRRLVLTFDRDGIQTRVLYRRYRQALSFFVRQTKHLFAH
jgi:hypothetical protein